MNIENNITNKRSLGAKRQFTYMVTIRKYKVLDFVSKGELTDLLTSLINRTRFPPCCVSNVVFEIEPTYKQLHLHCILATDTNFKYSRYTKAPGFRIHFRRVYDFAGCVDYLNKQVNNPWVQEQLISENYFNHNYGFA